MVRRHAAEPVLLKSVSGIFHLNLSTIKRSKGRNVVQLVAYITGEPLKNHDTLRTFGRRSTETIINYGSIGPDLPLEQLWNLAEEAEHRKDSVVGRHVIVALPREQSRERMLAELEALARHIHRVTAAPVVFSLHQAAGSTDEGNPHGHLVFAARAWDPHAGNFGKKTKVLDDWQTGPETIEEMRKRWEDIVNESLTPLDQPVSRKSKLRRGSQSPPRRHLGYFDWRRKLAGIPIASADYNRLIDDLEHCLTDLAQVESRLAQLQAQAESEVARDLLPCQMPKQPAREQSTHGLSAEQTSLSPISPAQLRASAPLRTRLRRRHPEEIPEAATGLPVRVDDVLSPPTEHGRAATARKVRRPDAPTAPRDLPC